MKGNPALMIVAWTVLHLGTLMMTPPLHAAPIDMTYVETEPDRSLLYVIRPKGARGGNSVGTDLFANESFLLRLDGNSYSYTSALTARPLETLSYNPERSKAPTPLRILVPADQEIRDLQLVQVGTWQLPEPAPAMSLRGGDSGWVATFKAWDLLRHLRPGAQRSVRFEGHFGDGASFAAAATLAWTPAEK